MHRNVRSRVTINGSFSNNFLVQIDLYQGSVLRPLLFTVVLEVLSKDRRARSPEELLYADDLALFSKPIEVLKGKLEPSRTTMSQQG